MAAKPEYAGEGAVRQEGPLPITTCKQCHQDIVWATSRKTGKKYPVTVVRGYLDQRYYNKRNAHTREQCAAAVATTAKIRESMAQAEQDRKDADALRAQLMQRPEVIVFKEDHFRGHGLLNPWGFLYSCTGPDGTEFTNSSLKTLREVVRKKCGAVVFTLEDRTAGKRGEDPSHVN